MYFDTNLINSILLCKNCAARLDIPKLLPCGENICSECEKSIQFNENKFDCLVCKNKHEITKEGLPINKPIKALLFSKPAEVLE